MAEMVPEGAFGRSRYVARKVLAATLLVTAPVLAGCAAVLDGIGRVQSVQQLADSWLAPMVHFVETQPVWAAVLILVALGLFLASDVPLPIWDLVTRANAKFHHALTTTFNLDLTISHSDQNHVGMKPNANLASSADVPIQYRIEEMSIDIDGNLVTVPLGHVESVIPRQSSGVLVWPDQIFNRHGGGLVRLGYVLAIGEPGKKPCRRLRRQARSHITVGDPASPTQQAMVWTNEINTEESI